MIKVNFIGGSLDGQASSFDKIAEYIEIPIWPEYLRVEMKYDPIVNPSVAPQLPCKETYKRKAGFRSGLNYYYVGKS